MLGIPWNGDEKGKKDDFGLTWEMGEKCPKKGNNGPKMEKMARKASKVAFRAIFPIFRAMFPHFPGEAKIHFSWGALK